MDKGSINQTPTRIITGDEYIYPNLLTKQSKVLVSYWNYWIAISPLSQRGVRGDFSLTYWNPPKSPFIKGGLKGMISENFGLSRYQNVFNSIQFMPSKWNNGILKCWRSCNFLSLYLTVHGFSVHGSRLMNPKQHPQRLAPFNPMGDRDYPRILRKIWLMAIGFNLWTLNSEPISLG